MESGNRKVNVTYYGMLAERLSIETEELELPAGALDLRDFFVEKHPHLAKYTFSTAVDLEYMEMLPENAQPNKIDIMPPFAGG